VDSACPALLALRLSTAALELGMLVMAGDETAAARAAALADAMEGNGHG